jgi:hypothetical protein
MQATFIDRTEHRLEREAPLRPLSFEGACDFTLMAIDAPAAPITAVLPSSLELGHSGANTPPERHPIILAMGTQRHVGQPAFPMPFFSYLELAIGIPSVYLSRAGGGYRGPFVYVTRLYVDQLWPLFLGRSVGYPKYLGRLHADSHSFEVLTLRKRSPLVRLERETYGLPQNPSMYPKFSAVRELMTQPIVSRWLPGIYLYTYFNWHFEDALLQPAAVTLQVFGDSLPGLGAGSYQWSGFDNAVFGAGALCANWKLTPPYPRTLLTADA